MPGIGVISNLYAKVNKNDPEHNTLIWYVLGNHGQLEVTHTLADLTKVCQEFKQQGLTHVGIIGGDGTVSLALSSLLHAYGPADLPRILLFRGGTFNVLASNLGIYGKPKHIMSDFLAAFHSSKPLREIKVTALRVNGRIGFLFANGLASGFLSEFYKNKKGMAGAAIFTSKVIFDGICKGRLNGIFTKITKPETMKIICEPYSIGQKEGDFSLVFASTVPRLPYGIPFFNQVKMGSPLAEAVAFRLTGGQLLAASVATAIHAGIPQQYKQSVVFNKCTILTRAGSHYTLDGDVLTTESGTIDIEIGPQFIFCSPYGSNSL